MLVTNVGGLPEIVEDGKVGYVVDVNVAATATAIVDFFKNDRLKEMTEGVRDNKGLFSWDKMVKAIENLFQLLKPSK